MKLTKNFKRQEFDSKDGIKVPQELIENVTELATNLEVLRTEIGEPVHVTSGYRSPKHNKKVGGKQQSFHLRAMAGDLTCKSKTPQQLADVIEKLIAEGKMKQGGIGVYPGFTHYDIRGTKARW